MNDFIAIIPARGGSKGIKKKNMVKLKNKPLIQYTLEAALKCNYISKTVVTSDDDEILNFSKSFGAISHKRSKELSTDFIDAVPVIKDVLEKYKRFKNFIYLQPTSPLRNTKHITEAISIFLKEKNKSVISVKKVENECLKYFKIKNGMLSGLIDNHSPFKRRQDLDEVVKANGAIYICEIETFLLNNSLLSDNTVPYYMCSSESNDIDNLDDLLEVEKILNERKKD